MPECEFGFRCYGNNCTEIKDLFSNIFKKTRDAQNWSPYDHIGTLFVKDVMEALELQKEIKRLAGSRILSVTLNVK